MYLDKRIKDDVDYSLHLAKPDVGSSSTTARLDLHQTASVVYASFGSLANLTEQHIHEIASAMNNSNYSFIWVLRQPEQMNLPTDFKQGPNLVLVSQLEVLNHPAIGCFLTHRGWNSVIEALGSGVPMVAMPQWIDQPTNAKFIQDVWQVGIRLIRINSFPNEISSCISEIMDKGPKSSKLRTNATKWKRLSQAAMDEGGSSDNNIDQFVLLKTYSPPMMKFLKHPHQQ